MATILSSDLTRESSILVDNRAILVTLTSDQSIQMKLKGMKSGVVSIPIETLYDQLNGQDAPVSKPDEILNGIGNDVLMSVSDFRNYMNSEDLDMETRIKFDAACADLIKRRKKQLEIQQVEKQNKTKNKNRYANQS